MTKLGKVLQVMGPVVDVYFENEMPSVNNALTINISEEENHGVAIKLTLEVS